MTITNHMLREKIRITNKHVARNNTTSTNATRTGSGDYIISVEEKKVVKVNGQDLIADDGTRGRLFNPLPCLFWKCLVTPDSRGDMVLSNPLTALFLTVGNSTYVVGVGGDSSEFELRCVIGGNEVRLNNDFLNIKATHLFKNGVEEK